MQRQKYTYLALVGFCLFASACSGFRVYKSKVSVEDIQKMQPFVATVENIGVDHATIGHASFTNLYPPNVSIGLLQHGSGDRLLLYIPASDKFGRVLADNFHEGESYNFPQVITELMTNQNAKYIR